MIEVSKIRADGGTQSRAAISEETVAEYAEAMANPETVFPPITVYFDGKVYWLADGFHRLAAWERLGRTEVPCDVRQGDRRRAILHSVAANSAHGLRRTNEDKRRAVLTLLEDDEWSRWSNREIARRCAVSESLVRSLRDPICAQNADSQARKVERGGTVYTQNTANIGAGSKSEQEVSTPVAQESKGDNSPRGPQNAVQVSTPSTPGQGAQMAPHEEARKSLSGLTRIGLEDEVIGLREALGEEKARRKKAEAEVKALKAQLADLTADDKADVIRRQEAAIRHQRSQSQKLVEDLKAEKRKTYALTKRVEELERMEIPLN